MLTIPLGKFQLQIGFESESSLGLEATARFSKDPFTFYLRIQGLLPFAFSLTLTKVA